MNTLTMTTEAAMFLMSMFLMVLYVMYVVFLSSPSVACTLSLDFLFLLFLSFSAYYRLIAEAASHSFIHSFRTIKPSFAFPFPILLIFLYVILTTDVSVSYSASAESVIVTAYCAYQQASR